MRPKPPEPDEYLPGDLAWFLEAYNRLGVPFSVTGMGGLVDRRSGAYPSRHALLDREWSADLDRDAPMAVWEDLDAYNLALIQSEIQAASSG